MRALNKSKSVMLVGYEEGVDRDGVGQYASRLVSAVKDTTAVTVSIKSRSIWVWIRELRVLSRDSDVIHLQYPCEGWGHSVLPSLAPFLMAKFLGSRKKWIVTLHEWKSMHPLRKLSLVPLLSVVNHIIFVTKRERDAFASSKLFNRRRAKIDTSVIPIGVNEAPSIELAEIKLKRNELASIPDEILLGYFGFIYAWKLRDLMAKVIAQLRERGVPCRLIIAGDFPVDHQKSRQRFFDFLDREDLVSQVNFLGYVESEQELATHLRACNCLLMLFSDGWSSRRSSFWYASQLGVPIVTMQPQQEDDFARQLYQTAKKDERLRLVRPDIAPNDLADEVMRFEQWTFTPNVLIEAPSWSEIWAMHLEIYESEASS